MQSRLAPGVRHLSRTQRKAWNCFSNGEESPREEGAAQYQVQRAWLAPGAPPCTELGSIDRLCGTAIPCLPGHEVLTELQLVQPDVPPPKAQPRQGCQERGSTQGAGHGRAGRAGKGSKKGPSGTQPSPGEEGRQPAEKGPTRGSALGLSGDGDSRRLGSLPRAYHLASLGLSLLKGRWG